jgi:hypothetical protein
MTLMMDDEKGKVVPVLNYVPHHEDVTRRTITTAARSFVRFTDQSLWVVPYQN